MNYAFLRYCPDSFLRAVINIALAWRMDSLNKAALHEQHRRNTFEFEDDPNVEGWACSGPREFQ